MECKNVCLIKGKKSDQLIGTLVMDESSRRIQLRVQLTLAQQAMIVGQTVADEPGDLAVSIATGVLKAVMNERARFKTPFGEDVSRNMDKAKKEIWSISINDIKEVSLEKAELKIKKYGGENWRLLFPSEFRARKWGKVIAKLINNEKVFIW